MSDSKQKGSLASLAQKKKGIPKLKTILSQPFPKYLPKIQLDDIKTIKDLIINDKHEYNQPNYKKYRGIITGLNSIIRLLKNNKISCLLLSSGIKPFSILYQIITFALTTGQPKPYILYAPNLNEIIYEIFQIDSFALAFKRDKFTKLEEYMKEKCIEYPLPKNFLIYHGMKQKEQQESMDKIAKVKPIDDKVNFNELYVLKTHAINSRSFYPKNAKNLKPLKFEESKEFSGNYISFANTENDVENETIGDSSDYKTDKKNLINVMNKHFSTPDVKMKNITQLKGSQQKLCKKIKKTNLNVNQNTIVEYEPLKIKKIQGNLKKKNLKRKKLN